MPLGIELYKRLAVSAVSPSRLGENLLKHQRVHINQANLEKMERKDGKLLVFEPVCRHLTAFAIEKELALF